MTSADVLHHDVPGRLPGTAVCVLDEVVDPDNVRVFHLGQELPFGDRRRHGVRVSGIQQAFQYHPAVADVAVPGQVDPAEPAEGEAAEHLVLPCHQIARLQLRAEREPGAAVAAEPLGQPGPAIPAAPDRLLAAGAKAPVLRHLRIGEHGTGRVAVGHRRDLHQARPSRPRADRPLVRRDPRLPEVRRLTADPRTPRTPRTRWPGPPEAEAAAGAEAAARGLWIWGGAAARPQTLQYPSSIVPPQLVQVLIATAPP